MRAALPLEGKVVLVTRPGLPGRELAAMIAAAGAEARWYPALDFQTTLSASEWMRRAKAADGVVISSLRAVTLYDDALDLRGVRAWVVGQKSAAELSERGVDVVRSEDAGLDALVAGMLAAGEVPATLFWPHGSLSCAESLSALQTQGAIIDRAEVYRVEDLYAQTGLDAKALIGVDAIVFASPSAVNSFKNHGAADALMDIVFVAIGATTAEALADFGKSCVRVAKSPSNAAMLAALIDGLVGPRD